MVTQSPSCTPDGGRKKPNSHSKGPMNLFVKFSLLILTLAWTVSVLDHEPC